MFNCAVNMQMVRQNAGAYLAKYMSKGAGDIQKLKDAGKSHMLPSHWYTCTRDLMSEVKRQTIVLNDAGRGPGVFDVLLRNQSQLFRGEGIRMVYLQARAGEKPVAIGAIAFIRDALAFEAVRAIIGEVKASRKKEEKISQLALFS